MIINKLYNTLSLGAIVMLFACRSESIKPVKLFVDGQVEVCNGRFVGDRIIDALCLNDSGDTIATLFFRNHTSVGDFTSYYPSQTIRSTGQIQNAMPVGVWKSYFPDGGLESYRYFLPGPDSSTVFYYKRYANDGQLEENFLPVAIRDDLLPGSFNIGQTYSLTVELQYSEFDSLALIAVVSVLEGNLIKLDTLDSSVKTIDFEFIPRQRGEMVISGTIYELDGLKNYSNEEFSNVAEWPFEYKFIVED